MEEVWRLSRGSWSSMQSPIELYDEEGDPLDAPAGYSPNTRWFGDEDGFSIELYSADPEAETAAPTPYLVMVYSLGDRVEHILVEDFPSLLQLLKDMAPVLDLTSWSWDSEDEEEEEEEEDIFGDGAERE